MIGQAGRLDMTIKITRANTGTVETVQMVGFLDPADLEQFIAQQEAKDGEEAEAR